MSISLYHIHYITLFSVHQIWEDGKTTNDNFLKDVKYIQIDIAKHSLQTERFYKSFDSSLNKISFMLWNNLNDIMPLAPKLEIENFKTDEYVNYIGYSDFYDASRWRKNIMQNALWEAENVDENTILFRQYISAPGWSFPYFTTSYSPKIDTDTKAISFRYKLNQKVGAFRVGMYIIENDGEEWVRIINRTDTADSWNQILFSKDGFSRTETGKQNDGILDLSNIKNICVGLYMPQKLSAKGFDFYIKDFGFVKKFFNINNIMY